MTHLFRTPWITALAALLAVAVGMGWLLGVPWLLTFGMGDVTVKPMTALGFVSASASCAMLCSRRDAVREGSRGFASACLLTVFAVFLEYQMGGTSLSGDLEPAHMAVDSVAPGVPSLGTAAALFFLSVSSLLRSTQRPFLKLASLANAAASAIGAAALVGHSLGIPSLYFLKEDTSTAMAVVTALLSLTLGLHGYFRCERLDTKC